ncbi:hypothetical protein BDP81DRAFT_185822 [Colletotrichum phormii]|uniref:Uncharacterized protein n=1 Tax=Colletotrichum phormii TaxID=359342 RepID=A0AAI9ZXC6_9PEZI|nr:uncharacterized protein BDP81DRAFT_185822 [Colletotrichum phormii]KAK1639950.1 hypothetical protein BDP81DRAFT_185822 [Colletotrichum phormii]
MARDNGCQPGNTNPKPMETAASSHATAIKQAIPFLRVSGRGLTAGRRQNTLHSTLPNVYLPPIVSRDPVLCLHFESRIRLRCWACSSRASGCQDSEVRNHSACTIDKPCRTLPRPHRSRLAIRIWLASGRHLKNRLLTPARQAMPVMIRPHFQPDPLTAALA